MPMTKHQLEFNDFEIHELLHGILHRKIYLKEQIDSMDKLKKTDMPRWSEIVNEYNAAQLRMHTICTKIEHKLREIYGK